MKTIKIFLRLFCILFTCPYTILFGLLIPTLGIVEVIIRGKTDSLEWVDEQKQKIIKYAFGFN